MNSRIGRLSPAAPFLLLLSLPCAVRAGSPVTIGDGSVCISDFSVPFSDTEVRHGRAFDLQSVLVEQNTTGFGDKCEPGPRCTEGQAGCTLAPKYVIVIYKEGNDLGVIAILLEGKSIQVTGGGYSLPDWKPKNGTSRTAIARPSAKIERIYVDNQVTNCTQRCRVTIFEPPSASAP